MATGFVVSVGALAVPVEDHDERGRAVDGGDGVAGHGGEVGASPVSTVISRSPSDKRTRPSMTKNQS